MTNMLRNTAAVAVTLLAALSAMAGPVAEPGDVALRHDIQVLADYGAITGPVTTWPISWDSLRADLEAVKADDVVLPNAVIPTFERILARARLETSRGEHAFRATVAIAEKPVNIRPFSNVPREDAEIGAAYSWANERFSVDLNVSGVDNPADGDDIRADGSQVAVELGNWSAAISTMDRWWGPGWDGSLILSNNARPIPAITFGRNQTRAFESRWLSWIGPWDLDVIWGQLEKDRFVPNARFFGMRMNFRPIRGLEIGVSRSAQWCGQGRPCGFDTFLDLLLGRDNVGDAGTTPENEPGNQMAGFDARWTNLWFGSPVSLYGQMIGEDEAGGFPSRYLAQFGIEGSGITRGQISYRWFAEIAGTSCDVVKREVLYNCAYRNSIYRSGYTYNKRIVGHGLDNDARVVSAGLILVSRSGDLWQAIGRAGDLNRVGLDANHSVATEPQDLLSLDLQHSRSTRLGRFDIGIGYEQREIVATGASSSDARGYVRWTSR
jgi:hypothetical protein